MDGTLIYDLLTNSVIILSNLAGLSFGEGSDWVQSWIFGEGEGNVF